MLALSVMGPVSPPPLRHHLALTKKSKSHESHDHKAVSTSSSRSSSQAVDVPPKLLGIHCLIVFFVCFMFISSIASSLILCISYIRYSVGMLYIYIYI